MAGGLAHGRRRRGVTAESHSEQQPLSILCLLPNAIVPSGWLAVGSDSGRGAERVGYVPMAPSHQGSRASTSMKDSAAFCHWLYSLHRVFACLGAGISVLLSCSSLFFHLQGLERQNGFPSLLGLGSDKDQVQPVLYLCLVPSRTAEKEKSWFCAPGVEKVSILLACAWCRLPC